MLKIYDIPSLFRIKDACYARPLKLKINIGALSGKSLAKLLAKLPVKCAVILTKASQKTSGSVQPAVRLNHTVEPQELEVFRRSPTNPASQKVAFHLLAALMIKSHHRSIVCQLNHRGERCTEPLTSTKTFVASCESMLHHPISVSLLEGVLFQQGPRHLLR